MQDHPFSPPGPKSEKEFKPGSLSQFDGTDGKPVYIAHRGRVIDVSRSKLWRSGLHMKRHRAGCDLTTEIEAAPHGREVLDRYPQVGVLKKGEEGKRPMPGTLSRLLVRFPSLRRHPHPMLVHFPIVFMFCPALFNLLYFTTGIRSFETTAWHCLGGGILFSPLAVGTGYYTWWLNYQAQPMRAVTIKTRLSLLLLAVSIVLFVWRMFNSEVLTSFGGTSIVYLLMMLSLIPIVTAIGWFGATLTFPLEKG
jgi:predicted heme/steroid binding protein/uncharacterized membrane protein